MTGLGGEIHRWLTGKVSRPTILVFLGIVFFLSLEKLDFRAILYSTTFYNNLWSLATLKSEQAGPINNTYESSPFESREDSDLTNVNQTAITAEPPNSEPIEDVHPRESEESAEEEPAASDSGRGNTSKSESSEGDSLMEEQVRELFEIWSETYKLTEIDPPKEVKPQSGWNITGKIEPFPYAPHLEDCYRKGVKRRQLELRGPHGELPDWAKEDPPLRTARPPWVLGADEDNLAYTRHMQAEIWKRQFPADCRDPSLKFGLVNWSALHGHGLGSALHIFSTRLAMLLKRGRIFVPFPQSLSRADHPDCKGSRRRNFDCFFYPLTSKACEEQAMELWSRQNSSAGQGGANRVQLFTLYRRREKAFMADLKGRPWREQPMTTELFGQVAKVVETMEDMVMREGKPGKELADRYVESNWWHAQAIRFALRAPTVYTCQAVNRVRHQVYGREVARNLLLSRLEQARVLSMIVDLKQSDEAALLESVLLSGNNSRSLEESVWWEGEPYVPRPIVSLHVRQGDKGMEMKLFSLEAHMWLAERLRRKVPDLKRVWLSTEMESVIQDSKKFPTWNFMFSKNMRQNGSTSMEEYTDKFGETELTVLSFANLIISSQCDFFIATLGSNWNRLINELRLTNGRLKAGVLALNIDEDYNKIMEVSSMKI